MSVEVVTVWAPRPNHEKWTPGYGELLRLQEQTAARFGHRYTVMTDSPGTADIVGNAAQMVMLPESLMKAMICGVIARLSLPVDSDLVFVDVDVLVARDLSEAFDGSFDIGLTRRASVWSPINNGAMYVAREAAGAACLFFHRAFELCGHHWGADQEAISRAAAPVPDVECVEDRDGVRFAFLSMRTHNVIPKEYGAKHRANPFCVHFKGDTKDWAQEYAQRYIFPR